MKKEKKRKVAKSKDKTHANKEKTSQSGVVNKLLELLASIKFWSIAAGVAAVISAVIAIIQIMPTKVPVATVRIGHYKIEETNRIVLHYILPTETRSQMSVLPFPIRVTNETNEDILNFSLEILSKSVETDEGRIPRLIPTAGYYEEAKEKCLPIKFGNSDKVTKIATISNENIHGVLQKNTGFYDNIAMYIFDKDADSNLCDAFDIEIVINSDKVSERRIKISVLCYYKGQNITEEVNHNIKKDIDNFLIIPSVYAKAKDPRTGFISYVYRIDNSNESITLIE